MTQHETKRCIACGSGTDQVPLIAFEYRKSTCWICPQHLPVLIHSPARLADKLPGAEHFGPPDHPPQQ